GTIVSVNAVAGASADTTTSCLIVEKPSIATSIVHGPSARSARRYRPSSSVTVERVAPACVAVTVAPGTGRPENVTWPRWSAADAVLAAAITTNKPRNHEIT